MRMLLIALTLVSTATLLRAEEMTHTKDSLDDVKKTVAAKAALLVDVREKEEWDKGHLKDATLFSLSALKNGQQVPADWPKDKPIYTHCAAGMRSLKAAEILKKQGYDVRALKPGYADLVKSGFEVAPK